MAIEGTNIPAGTLQPYEMITRKVLIIVAKSRDSTMDQRFFALIIVSLPQETLLPYSRTRRDHHSHGLPRIRGRASPSLQSYQSVGTY